MDNAIRALAERVISQLNNFYNGDSWVTDNFETKVLSLSPAAASRKVAGHSHSIAELTAHIMAWRNFAIQKLHGNAEYDIEDNSIEDWPEPTSWDEPRSEFRSRHHDLIAAIKNFPAEKWGDKVPGRNYSFLFLINGIIEHDCYHHGQIGSVLAELRKNDVAL